MFIFWLVSAIVLVIGVYFSLILNGPSYRFFKTIFYLMIIYSKCSGQRRHESQTSACKERPAKHTKTRCSEQCMVIHDISHASVQKSASKVNTCSPNGRPPSSRLCMTLARWYSPTRRSKKLLLPLVETEMKEREMRWAEKQLTRIHGFKSQCVLGH